MYGENYWPPSHEEPYWNELHHYNDTLARWEYNCQTELERWPLFLESKYQDYPDWTQFELVEE